MSLKARLTRQIRMDGPIPVSLYMQTCLHDPTDGYYARGAGLGRDFITAPETSQMFGELLGLWIVSQWRALDEPARFNLVEMGPGRGTLMADALRAAAPFLPPDAIKLHLIEASSALRKAQSEHLKNWQPEFADTLHAVPPGPTLLLANEFLDCLPARQFVQEGGVWRERIIGLDERGELAFGIDRSDLRPEEAEAMPPTGLQGEAELQSGLDGLIDTLTARNTPKSRFHALFIDYGTALGAPGDTLRAYKNGKQVHPLACPGDADLTVDVDFGRLAKLAQRAGLTVSGPVPQSAFLGTLGLQTRLDTLIKAHPNKAEALFAGAQKLVDPDQMGARFKAICLSSPECAPATGF